MIIKRVLREAAIRLHQPAHRVFQQLAASLSPSLAAMFRVCIPMPSQPRATHEKTRSFTRGMVVVLRYRIRFGDIDPSAMRFDE
jgi:hypothetical protein